MNLTLTSALFVNAALLSSLVLVYDLFVLQVHRKWLFQLITGLLSALIGFTLMFHSFHIGNGIIFDTRSILLSLVALFFGLIPALITAIGLIAFRLWQGGAGALVGVLVIIFSVLIGYGWRRIKNKNTLHFSFWEFYAFGFLVSLTMIGLMYFLRTPQNILIMKTIAFPVLLIYPITTALLSKLLQNRLHHKQTEIALHQSQTAYNRLYTHMESGVLEQELNGTILNANPAAQKILGLSEKQLIGMIPTSDRFSAIRVNGKSIQISDYTNYFSFNTTRRRIKNQVIGIIHQQTLKRVWLNINSYPISVNDKNQKPTIFSIFENITDDIEYQQKIEHSMQEKEILLRELHHRTRNNMQVISAMLQIQSITSPNNDLKIKFNEIDAKIQCMSLAQNKLYEAGNLSQLNLKDYMKELLPILHNSFNLSDKKIHYLLNMPDIFLNIDLVHPLGLIVTELMANVYKHAFTNQTEGEIHLQIYEKNNQIEFLFQDSGCGLPENLLSLDFGQHQMFGLNTILLISKTQLNGNVTIKNNPGFSYQLLFPKNSYQQRI